MNTIHDLTSTIQEFESELHAVSDEKPDELKPLSDKYCGHIEYWLDVVSMHIPIAQYDKFKDEHYKCHFASVPDSRIKLQHMVDYLRRILQMLKEPRSISPSEYTHQMKNTRWGFYISRRSPPPLISGNTRKPGSRRDNIGHD